MVLATEMSKHFLHVNKFNSVFGRVMKVKGIHQTRPGLDEMNFACSSTSGY